VKLTIRLTPGTDDDLIAWLENLDVPWGLKGQKVKDALRRGIGNLQQKESFLDLTVLLPEIRRVVAAGVADALSGFQISQSAARIDPGVEEETENMLDQLGGFLILDETAISGRSRP
jgi:hypothetical protein